jgi:hypothetical protein
MRPKRECVNQRVEKHHRLMQMNTDKGNDRPLRNRDESGVARAQGRGLQTCLFDCERRVFSA